MFAPMIVEYVRYRLTGDADEFEAAYARAQVALRASPECLAWELTRCHEEADRYILRIEWDSIEGHLEKFRKGSAFPPFLAAIRPYVDQIEEMQHYAATAVRSHTIYQAMGGAGAFFAIARRMHERMRDDALLGRRFANVEATHVPHLAMWLVEVFGGPKLYSMTLGDIAPMLAHHANQRITEEERARFVAIAREAAAASAPAGEEAAVEAIARYFEWGSHVAVTNSASDHVPDPSAGVPTWDWDAQH
jgi:truncated hemoglobin YjbI/heme-degrading monooxygenase HmoA